MNPKKFQSLFYWITYSYMWSRNLDINKTTPFQSLFYWITYSYLMQNTIYLTKKLQFQSLFYWITYSYPFCRENLLFIITTEFFSDIKIIFFSIFLVIFCLFFTIFRNSKYVFLLVLRGFFSTFLFPVVVGIFLQTYFTILF